MSKYDDLINLEHPISQIHKRMDISLRAGIFAPFKALNGFDDKIEDTKRYTLTKPILSEEQKEIINLQLNIINNVISTNPQVILTTYVPDRNKEGGIIEEFSSKIIKIDQIQKIIVLDNKRKIYFKEILAIESDILPSIFNDD